MLSVIILTLLSVIVVSLISLVGITLLGLKEKTLHTILLEMVSFSVGALLGEVFIHLLPEIANETGLDVQIGLVVLTGFMFSFVVEKFIHWHHCHDEHCEHGKSERGIKPYAVLNLIGDGVHNFIDGVIIAAAYLASVPLGLATTLAVVLHEIPQEIGDFAVLIHGGFSKGKALAVNLLSAITAVIGAVLTLILSGKVENLVPYVLPFAAGTFLYIAATDLIPELHKETRTARSVCQFAAILAGVGVMALLLLVG